MRLAPTVATAAMIGCTISTPLHAQSKCDLIKPSNTAGLKLSITKTVAAKEIIIDFSIANMTSGRAYLKSAQFGDAGRSTLRSGTQTYNPTVSGLESTQGGSASTCASNPSCSQDLNTFSYVEPKDSLPFSFRYNVAGPVNDSDAISFSVSMVGRFSKSTDTLDQAGPPHSLRFNFNSIPLGC